MDAFVEWARAEIARLRAEADHLERTVTRFLATRPSVAPSGPRPITRADDVISRRTKNAPILDAIDHAGEAGLSLDEIEQAARTAGLNMSRDNLRSFLFNQKRVGRIVALGVGRFAAHEAARDKVLDAPQAASFATPTSSPVEPAAGGGT